MATGYHDWTAGETVTAANVEDYLQLQSDMVFASTAARDTALASVLREGLICTVTGTDRVYKYNGTGWEVIAWYASTGRVGGEWRRLANQAIANNTETDVSWDTETTDSDAFLVPDATTGVTFTVPSALGGLYTVSAIGGWSAASTSGYMLITTSTGINVVVPTEGLTTSSVTGMFPLAAADTFKVRVFQASGGSLNFTGRVYVARLGA